MYKRQVEDGAAKSRIDDLRSIPAVVKFLSCEPLIGELGRLDLTDIDWVIVGGESGAQARHMDPLWAEAIRDQCSAASVPFFFKQWGGRTPKANGRHLDGRLWDELPRTALTAPPPSSTASDELRVEIAL